MKLKQGTLLDLFASFVGLLVVLALLEIRAPVTPSFVLLQGVLAAAGITVLFLVYRRVG